MLRRTRKRRPKSRPAINDELNFGDGGPSDEDQRQKILRYLNYTQRWNYKLRQFFPQPGSVLEWVFYWGAGLEAERSCDCRLLRDAMDHYGWWYTWKHRQQLVTELKAKAAKRKIPWTPKRTFGRAVWVWCLDSLSFLLPRKEPHAK